MERTIHLINSTGSELFVHYEVVILKSLRETGKLPEELADLFVVKISPVVNPDDSPRYIIEAA